MLYIIIALLILFIFVILESIREIRSLRVTEYNISVDKDITSRKIVFLSDYHESKGINDKIISKVKEADPDIVLLGGDMLNGKDEDEDLSPAIDLINAISEDYPVYFGMGNHETKVKNDYYGTSELWDKLLKGLSPKVKMLINEKVSLDGIGIYGLDIPIMYYKRVKYPVITKEEIEESLGKPDDDFNILLGHTPDFIGSYARWGADLVLSGHFHGGIVRLPLLGGVISPRLRFFPKYDYGRYEESGTTMIVTNGLGQHSMKLRFYNIPEICVINISKE